MSGLATDDWPIAIDWQQQAFVMQQVTRGELAAAAFLDHRLHAGSAQDRMVKFSTIGEPLPQPPPSYIIHSAFCGSTLLARLLDYEGGCLALKEPHVLTQLAEAKRRLGGTARATLLDPRFSRIFGLSLGLIGNRGEAGTLIKPTNFANNLVPEIIHSGARILFLYANLNSFLRSIVKRGEEGHVFVRQRWQAMLAENEPLVNIQPSTAMLYTDLQISAIIWAQQIDTFQYWLRQSDGQRCASADFASYRPDPGVFVRSVAKFLMPGCDAETVLARMHDSAALDSKTGTERSAVEAADSISVNDEAVIGDVIGWAQSINFGTPIVLPLAHDVMALR